MDVINNIFVKEVVFIRYGKFFLVYNDKVNVV